MPKKRGGGILCRLSSFDCSFHKVPATVTRYSGLLFLLCNVSVCGHIFIVYTQSLNKINKIKVELIGSEYASNTMPLGQKRLLHAQNMQIQKHSFTVRLWVNLQHKSCHDTTVLLTASLNTCKKQIYSILMHWRLSFLSQCPPEECCCSQGKSFS